jgi:hypothetical protein
LLARDGHRMSLASLALKQRKMYFQHTKDTASAQSLKETDQQRKKLGGTLRFGRYYLFYIIVDIIFILKLSNQARVPPKNDTKKN